MKVIVVKLDSPEAVAKPEELVADALGENMAASMDCDNCGRRDACSGICEKAAPTEVEEASAL